MSDVNKCGRPRAIESPQEFLDLSNDYVEWVLSNPVYKTVTASFQGEINFKRVPHSRPMTQYGWASHLGIGLSTLKDYGSREEYSAIFKVFNNKMTTHNIDGATSGDFNATIIARLEGLAEKREVEAKVNQVNSMDDFYNDIEAEP